MKIENNENNKDESSKAVFIELNPFGKLKRRKRRIANLNERIVNVREGLCLVIIQIDFQHSNHTYNDGGKEKKNENFEFP